MGPDRLHRLRRTASAHRAAAQALRRAARLAVRRGVRGRDRGQQPDAGAGLDPARDLLRLAAGRPGGGAAWRGLLHPARPGGDPGTGRALPGRAPAAAGRRGRGRGRSGGPGRCRRGGDRADPGQLAPGRRPRQRPRRQRSRRRHRTTIASRPGAGAVDRLPAGRRHSRGARRHVPGPGSGRLRPDRARGARIAQPGCRPGLSRSGISWSRQLRRRTPWPRPGWRR